MDDVLQSSQNAGIAKQRCIMFIEVFSLNEAQYA